MLPETLIGISALATGIGSIMTIASWWYLGKGENQYLAQYLVLIAFVQLWFLGFLGLCVGAGWYVLEALL